MMRQPYPLSIALRYLRSRRQSAFISFISAVSMLGVALAVAVLIVVMAVVNGFESELEQRILSVMPDASVYGYDRDSGAEAPLADWQSLRSMALERSDIEAASPFVEGQGLVTGNGRLVGVTVRGVDPALEPGVSSLDEHLVAGSFGGLDEKWHTVIGSGLADELGVSVGDKVTLVLPEVRSLGMVPVLRQRRFTVAGIFDVGMAEFDRGLIVVDLASAAALYRTDGRASGLSLKVDDRYAAHDIVWEFATAAANRLAAAYVPEDWTWRHSNIFRSIALTRTMLFIMLSLVVAIAAFNIISTLVMVVREKRGDIAILRSLGSAPRNILSIFFAQGSCIGLIGTLGGVGLGLALSASLGTIVGWIERLFSINLLSPDVYLVSGTPTDARPGEIVRICVLALGLAMLATVYPAWQASRQPPAEALRNE